MNKRDQTMVFITMVMGGGFHLLTIFTDQIIVARSDVRNFYFFIHVLCLVSSVFYLVNRKRFPDFFKAMSTLHHWLVVLGYAYVLYWISGLESELGLSHVKAWTAFVVLGIFSIVVCPYHRRIVTIYSIIFVSASFFAWSQTTGGAGMLGISMLAFIGAEFFQRAIVKRSFSEALREFFNRSLIAKAQKEAYEQQLIVARRIQDSLLAGEDVSHPGVDVRFFQHRSQAVGGDWMAVRTDKQGHVFAVIADASGKGVQAALVIHAIQALWADALSREEFEPHDWLTQVNGTLCRMGRTSAHSATIGILRIGFSELEYWSAGHLPALMQNNASGEIISSLGARGSLLGVSMDVEFKSTKQAFPEGAFEVFLGTDGVFEKGTSQNLKSIQRIVKGVRTSPEFLSMGDFETDDDRTLVCLRVDPLVRRTGHA